MNRFRNAKSEQQAGARTVCMFCPCSSKLSMCGKYFPAQRVRAKLQDTPQPELIVCDDCERVNAAACFYCGCSPDEECDLCQG